MYKYVEKYASGKSCVVRKGTLLLPISGGTTVDEHQAPDFATDIISFGELSEFNNVSLTGDPPVVVNVRTGLIQKSTD